MGGYPDSNRELTVPHTVVLPIELYLPYYYHYLNLEPVFFFIITKHAFLFYIDALVLLVYKTDRLGK